jgi:hypothetical protein
MSFNMNNTSNAAGNSFGQQQAGMQEKIPKGYRKGVMQQFTPEQMQLFQQLFSHLSPDGYLSKLAGGDESMFEQMEAPAMRQFSELQGQLGSRFSGMGMGASKGSGFQNSMNAATSNFVQDLHSKRQEMQRQALMDLMGLGNQLMSQKPYEQMLSPKSKKSSFWEQLLGGVSGASSQAGGAAGMNQLLQLLSSLF